MFSWHFSNTIGRYIFTVGTWISVKTMRKVRCRCYRLINCGLEITVSYARTPPWPPTHCIYRLR